MHGDGLQSRDFTFIADAVQANLCAATAPADGCAGKAFNIARGEPVVAARPARHPRRPARRRPSIPDHVEPRPGDVRHSHADIAAARRDLGYTPSTSFADGLARTVTWFRARAEASGAPQEVEPMTGATTTPAAGAAADTDSGLAAELLRKWRTARPASLIVGQGYVGLPVAMRAVEVGFAVVGLEASPERAAALQAGSSYVGDVPDDQLPRRARRPAIGRSATPPTSDRSTSRSITVPTPLRDGAPDLSYVEDAAASLARRLRAGALVVLESTTYPGTTDELLRPILEQGSGLRPASSSSATRPSASTPATPGGAS